MLQSRVRAGEMDREITFVKKVLTQSAFNTRDEASWVRVDQSPTVFARMKEIVRPRGNEEVIADRIVSIHITVFTVRYRTDITTENNRVIFEGRPYNIVHVMNTDGVRGSFLDVQTELVDNETWS